MDDQYAEIKAELELTKNELKSRIFLSTSFTEGHSYMMSTYDADKKERMLLHNVQEDLRDVEIALLKMEYGVFGICEDTGLQIPIEKLKILPTARSIYDFSFNDLFERKTVPQIYPSYIY
ncbi:TraR/DksA family transcriptional regulator [Bacillus timonensis]|nr:TraR/DksA family transcriptional regulator [Bacillus timonensis]